MQWDATKARRNLQKYGVSFEEAKELLTSTLDFLEIYDDDHSEQEDRFFAIGPIRRGLILVVYTQRHEATIRIISARWATPNEKRLYRHYQKEHP